MFKVLVEYNCKKRFEGDERVFRLPVINKHHYLMDLRKGI
jgi:hypothetical protein